ncbi:peptide chain release factor 2 [Planctomycetales bacterium]|nr:peptide chain release factor 2 [Planctomycetales bacterium]
MPDPAEIKNIADACRERLTALATALKIAAKRDALAACDAKIAAPDFWLNGAAQKTVAERKVLAAVVEPFSQTAKTFADAVELWELARAENDDATAEEAAAEILTVPARLQELDNMALLSGKHDAEGAYFSIHTGAGGSDACEWAEMLLRMYLRFFERRGWQAEILSLVDGEEAGLRGVDLRVAGEYAYGKLRGEMGVHRLVRISPFSGRRETSFAAVDVTPDFQQEVNLEIADKDLRIDTYRAGGKGGQHVNKTDSAVRVTHLPTGIVVAVQNERSQHSNKLVALKALKARLLLLEEEKRLNQASVHHAQKMDNAFGSQIRNYVMNPYTLVKDARTDCQTGNIQAVLDGEIDAFIDAYLRRKAATE